MNGGTSIFLIRMLVTGVAAAGILTSVYYGMSKPKQEFSEEQATSLISRFFKAQPSTPEPKTPQTPASHTHTSAFQKFQQEADKSWDEFQEHAHKSKCPNCRECQTSSDASDPGGEE